MKARQILPLCLASASLAHQTGTLEHNPNLGICRTPTKDSFSGLSVCQPDNSLTLSGNDTVAAPAVTYDVSRWKHQEPCFRNGTDEFCVYSAPDFAEGRGVSMILPKKRAAKIATLPAFADPESIRGINQDLVQDRPPVYNVVEMPGKGLGVVAAKHLVRGDLIIANTVSIMIDYEAFGKMPQHEVNKLMAAAVDYFPEMHRSRFLNLSTHADTMSHLHKVERLVATNAFDLEGPDDGEFGMHAVFPEISRLNHDCRANGDYFFDYETLTHRVHATRNIAAGEEITVSYIDPLQSLKRRTSHLKGTWGFDCSCSACTAPKKMAAASDSRLKQMAELRKEFEDYTTESRATPAMGELMVSLYAQERLSTNMYSAHTYAALEYNGVGEPWEAARHANLAIEYGLASVGPTDPDVKEMQTLVADPYAHWSWMLRTKKRMRWGKQEAAAGGN